MINYDPAGIMFVKTTHALFFFFKVKPEKWYIRKKLILETSSMQEQLPRKKQETHLS